MWIDLSNRKRAWAIVVGALLLSSTWQYGAAQAQDRLTPYETNDPAVSEGVRPAGKGKRTARREVERRGGQYFVEFRSRYALSYGHTFLVHGRLNERGEVGQVRAEQVAGLHPAGDGPQLWSVGHVLPVPAETGPSDGDLEDEYISNRFRVTLSEPEYRRVAAHIRNKQKNSPTWHAVIYNCNRWVGEVAQYMGLKAPDNTLLYPAEYISSLRALNSGGPAHDNMAPASLSSR